MNHEPEYIPGLDENPLDGCFNMPVKNHPILTVIIILVITIIALFFTMTAALEFIGSKALISFSDKIGVIPIEGMISDSTPIVDQLVKYRKNKNIKAIILRIESPGGGVGASQEIYREIIRTRKTKKVITSMGGIAASGGYYIAAASDMIVANPGTITGSIGVIMKFYQIQELSKKLGISFETLKSGRFKDLGSPHRELTEQEKALIQDLISDIQEQFVNAVSTGRNLPKKDVLQIADGRIMSGAQAKEYGLIDLLGNFQDAIDLTKDLANIEGEPVLEYPKKSEINLWDMLVRGAVKSISQEVIDNLKTDVEYSLDMPYLSPVSP